MADAPLISIIVPVYNTEKLLPKCVDSIIAQTYKNLEIILINDGSTDGSAALCDSYAGNDSRIKVIHQSNRGLAGAVKCGIENAGGEFAGFADSDDYIAEDMIEKLVEVAEKNNADLVQCNFIKVFENGNTAKYSGTAEMLAFEGADIKSLALTMLNDYENIKNFSVTGNRWTKLVRAEILKKNCGYVKDGIKIGEDFNLMFPVLLDCRKIVLIPDFLYFYYQRGNSMTKGFMASLESDYEKQIAASKEIINDKAPLEEFYAAVRKKEYAAKLSLIRNICRSGLPRKEKKAEIKRIHKTMKKVKIRQSRPKQRLLQRGLEILLALRFYGVITLLVK